MDIQTAQENANGNRNSRRNWIIAWILGAGRIVSSAALQSLAINGAFELWRLPSAVSQSLAGTAAVSNSISNATTRITSVYSKLPSNRTENTSTPTQQATINNLTPAQKGIVYTLLTIGVVDSLYFAANNFNAIVELRCNLFGDENCEVNFWGANPAYYILAGYGAASGLIVFFAFNLTSVKDNATELAIYSGNHREANREATNKKHLVLISLIALLNSISISAMMYFTTSKSVHDFFAGSKSENLLLNTLVPIAIIAAIITNLFSQVANAKKLLKQLSEEGPSKFVNEWFREPKGWIKARTLFGLPFFLADTIFGGIAAYAGTHKLLKNADMSPLVITIIAIVNAVNTGFLYFAFNTRNALDKAADVKVNKPSGRVGDNQHSFHSTGNHSTNLSETTALLESTDQRTVRMGNVSAQ